MTYTELCSSYLCNPNYGLTCSSTANSCQCPSNMALYRCDCATTQYWNGARCVERSTYNNACPTLQNYNCYSGKNMICSGGTCLCVNSDYYWVSALDSCSNFFLFCFNIFVNYTICLNFVRNLSNLWPIMYDIFMQSE